MLARLRTSAICDPWPPAFIFTAPPIDPGMPTAHSKPVRLSAAVSRASGCSPTRASCLNGLSGPVDLDRLELTPEGDDEPGEPCVGHQHVRSPPDHEHREGSAHGGESVMAGGQPLLVAGQNEIAARPPTRYVVLAPSGASRVASFPRACAILSSTALSTIAGLTASLTATRLTGTTHHEGLRAARPRAS